ncbi:SDH family Clp fold serine proteinase [Oceanidesulfovibrio marinus]|uniref:Serine protease n=1 Tax=Oceanidesulfovibrio marinus TaxID=370038 RepID=A0A6P1ZKL1_9BACT|nr:serine protease [Oceanidesulfovibrio marinus]TVM35639.1 serine protease [Oceanidesulfovibrio marinus]
MYQDRVPLYKEIEKQRNSKVLCYVTGDRRGMETQIHPEVLDMFVEHLDEFGLPIPKITLFLYSPGGITLAGWSIVNLIKIFADSYEVIVPFKAHSTATLMCLGADAIVMTKQATLGPIDPSVNSAFNPTIPNVTPPGATLPVSVESVKGFFELAKENLPEQTNLSDIFLKLADYVHPIALGNVYRSRAQIQMLARELLQAHMKDKKAIDDIISFLCSDSGSHDYTINRREAKNRLKLPVENPSQQLYAVIKKIYLDIRNELKLNEPFNPETELGTEDACDYECAQAIIESVDHGSHQHFTAGHLQRFSQPQGNFSVPGVANTKTFFGWRFTNEQQ